jgi:hypothetical protein
MHQRQSSKTKAKKKFWMPLEKKVNYLYRENNSKVTNILSETIVHRSKWHNKVQVLKPKDSQLGIL